MANDYFTKSGWPATSSAGASSTARSEIAAVETAFDKLPALTGNANKGVVVNAGATGLTVAGTLSGSNTGNETTTTIGTLINGATSKATPVDTDQVGLMDSAASNIMKKLSWANIKATLFASPTFTGIPAAPTAAALTNTTQLATTEFATTADNLKAALAGSATQNFTAQTLTLTNDLAVTEGGTGASTAAAARTSLGAAASAGTTTNDNAAAGQLGEYLSSVVAAGSAVSLVSAAIVNVTSLSLTAGDWDVSGNVIFVTATTTAVARLLASINVVSAATSASSFASLTFAPAETLNTAANGSPAITPNIARISVAVTTTVYLVAGSIFGTSTATAYGMIAARRVR